MIYLFLLGRVLLGWFLLMNGFNHFKNLKMLTGYAASKGAPVPKLSVIFTGLLLLLGGAGIILGVQVQWALLLTALFFILVTPVMHKYWTISDPNQRMAEHVNFYKNMGILGAVLMLLMIPVPWAAALM